MKSIYSISFSILLTSIMCGCTSKIASSSSPVKTNDSHLETLRPYRSAPLKERSIQHTVSTGNLILSAGQSLSMGDVELVMQTAGNLVLYQSGTPLWATNFFLAQSIPAFSANGNLQNCQACQAVFQPDGNLVLYNNGAAYWASGTGGNPGAVLSFSDTAPFLSITSSSGTILSAPISAYTGFTIFAGQGLSVGNLDLVMQPSGNLVLYQGGTALWATNFFLDRSLPAGSANGNLTNCQACQAVFQSDGNLILYNNGVPYWASGTSGNPGAVLTLSAAAPYLNIVAPSGELLSAQISSYKGFTLAAGQSLSLGDLDLVMQSTGNLVLYQGGAPLWATNFFLSQSIPAGSANGNLTNCQTCEAVFQSDGNLVLYNSGIPYWASGTGGNPGAILSFSLNKPYLSIMTIQGAPLSAPAIRIQCLGDSNTWGFSPTGDPAVDDGYRRPLAQLLNNAGISFQFVGSQDDTRDPSFTQPLHDGYPGWAADDLLNGRPDLNPGVFPMNSVVNQQADVILLMAGTNDILVKGYSTDVVRSNLENLILAVRSAAPNAHIIVSTILPLTHNYAILNDSAVDLNVWVTSSLAQSGGSVISVVDNYSVIDAATQSDGVHATAAGYNNMAGVWFQGISNWIQTSGHAKN